MKLHFEPDLDYQLKAIDAVSDLFKGQEVCRTEFTVTRQALDGQMAMGFAQSDLGIGNRLTLLDDDLLKNLNAIQLRNGLAPSTTLPSGDFTIEMETGTGKTYVYLRTIFELNKRFGFTKFVIVVPSVAIKEGVYKSLQIMEEHFRALYANTPFEYFLYDSAKLGSVRNFATSPHIQIMVVTVGAINKKDVNNLYKDSEKTGGETPIDLIRATKPVLIVDEPQSVDGGIEGRGREALADMHPLCTLRYSATHVDQHHMVYRLDAVDAYEQKLVKQIEVASATVEDAHNRPYVRVVSTANKGGVITARVELDVATLSDVRRIVRVVQDGDDLEQTTGRPIYRDCRIGEIRVEQGNGFVELRVPGGEHYLEPGQAWGDVDDLAIKRQMIRRAIKEHLGKEKRLRPQGIKVLTLFFIDRVDKYRQYDQDGNVGKGEYARIFEEEYDRWSGHPDYRTLFEEVDFSHSAGDVHDGYFSIDRHGGWTEPDLDNEGQPRNQRSRDDAERGYNLIMKEKEKLLSFETPLKFIFSHSALREGWDNPNVFQICNLRDIRTERERRQTIGRGLRLCVNQNGERVRGFEVNTLTVIATEPFEDFAANLQKEIEADTGIRFGVVEPHQFASISVVDATSVPAPLGVERSKELWDHLKEQGLIDAKGQVQDSLRAALRDGTLAFPESFEDQVGQIRDVLRKLAGRLEIRNADERRRIEPRRTVLDSPEFKELWERIKYRTTYRVQFDNGKLIDDCLRAVQGSPPVARTRLQWRKADLAIGQGGITAEEVEGAATIALEEHEYELPDVLTELQDRTQLTRRTITRILIDSGRLEDFKRNPQEFIDRAADTINRSKRRALVNGVKYQRIGDSDYYAQELFEEKELAGYLKKMLLETKKSVYEQVAYDSTNEAAFAEELEKNQAVRVYAKLPPWFQVPTPLGPYNPDWAILVQDEAGGNRLYFVVETKGSIFTEDLRGVEDMKIECGKAHFGALQLAEPPAKYVVAHTFDDFVKHWP